MGLLAGSAVTIELESLDKPGQLISGHEALKNLVRVMGFDKGRASGKGLTADDLVFTTRVFAAALEHVAPLSDHGAAILPVAAALRDAELLVVKRVMGAVPAEMFKVSSRVGADDMADTLDRLGIGQHAFFTINNHGLGAPGHSLGLSMSRLGADMARVSLVNSVEEAAGVFVDVPIHRVRQGLPAFFSGQVFNEVCAMFDPTNGRQSTPSEHAFVAMTNMSYPEKMPTRPTSSMMFAEWMKTLQPGKGLSNHYFDRKPLLQTPQKGGSCAVESVFALMATTLPRDAYKLAKAACLSTVLAMGEATGAVQPQDQARIGTRMNSAWGGIGSEPRTEKFRSPQSFYALYP